MAVVPVSGLPTPSLQGGELIGMQTAGGTAAATTPAVLAAFSGSADVAANVRRVGAGREYTALQTAIDSITDSGPTKPYLITVDPGVYTDSWSLNIPNVTIQGAGKNATIYNVSTGCTIATPAQNCILADLSITRDSAGGSAFSRSGSVWNSDIYRCSFINTSTGIAFNLGSGDVKITWNLYDCFAKSSGTTYGVSGHTRLFNCIGLMRGTTSGVTHYGVQTKGDFSRTYIYGGHYGTGYYFEDGSTDNAINDATGPCYGFYAAGNNNRVMVFNAHCFVRNELNTDSELLDNHVFHAENGAWFRIFGGNYQAETPTNISKNRAIYADGVSKVEVWGSRATRSDGATIGGTTIGIESITADQVLDKFEGGVKSVDASAGAVTVTLPSTNDSANYKAQDGEIITIKKTDASANAVTVTASGDTKSIEGGETVLLAAQWDFVSVIWDSSTMNWLKI